MYSRIETQPNLDLCGDFAEELQIDATRRALILGDIAGHGAEAGSAAQALLAFARAALLEYAALDTAINAIDVFFARALLCERVPFASLFVAIDDDDSEELQYASAGHEMALLFDRAGGHRHLEPTGPLLGLGAFQTDQIGVRSVEMGSSSILVVVTDGITEARRDEDGRPMFFGTSGIVKAVREARHRWPEASQSILEGAMRHSNDQLTDDATVLVSGRSARSAWAKRCLLSGTRSSSFV
jgi:serine phosphatase RsbU (regulator of sigma subunit)